MIVSAIAIFLIAALGGLYLASLIYKGQRPPTAIALLHGALAATGLVLVILAVIQGQQATLVRAGLGVLVVAALGGLYLFSFQLRGAAHPRAVVLLHGLLAVSGVGLLVLFAAS